MGDQARDITGPLTQLRNTCLRREASGKKYLAKKNICHLHLCFVRRRPRGFRRKAQKPPYQIGPYQSPPSSQDIIRHVSDTCPAPARHVGGPYEAVSPVVTSVGGVPGTEYSSHGVDSLLQTSHSSSFVPFNNNHVLSSVPGSNFFSQNDL